MPIPVKNLGVRYRPYYVKGKTLTTLLGQFKYPIKPGVNAAGYTDTEYRVEFHYDFEAIPAGKKYKVNITTTPQDVLCWAIIHMPIIKNPPKANLSDLAAKEWLRFKKRLKVHELGHFDVFEKELKGLVNDIVGSKGQVEILEERVLNYKPVKDELEKVEEEVKKGFTKKKEAEKKIYEIKKDGAGQLAELDIDKPQCDKLLKPLKTCRDRYDAKWNHGEKQGAKLDISIE
jgi:hypothetical protein